jgi:hypothetical protein
MFFKLESKKIISALKTMLTLGEWIDFVVFSIVEGGLTEFSVEVPREILKENDLEEVENAVGWIPSLLELHDVGGDWDSTYDPRTREVIIECL